MSDSAEEQFEQRARACWYAVTGGTPIVIKMTAPRIELPANAEREFRQFFEATTNHWLRIARATLRCWRAPTEVEDVLQEIRLVLWRRMWKWDPSRNKSIRSVLRWSAKTAAKEFVHAQRCASSHGTRDKNKSRVPLPFSSFVRDGEDHQFEVEVPAQQERIARARLVIAGTSEWERLILRAFISTGGDESRAAVELFGRRDPKFARLAKRAIRSTLANVVV
jgi:DNA-directed RNA polymerase specialized sigma24 family protein